MKYNFKFKSKDLYIWYYYHNIMVVFSITKEKILNCMVENREEDFTIRSLSDLIKIDYKNCNIAIKELEKENLIITKKIGNSLICNFTNNYTPFIGYVEYLRQKVFLKKREFKLLVNDLELIPKPFICLLFGSHVKGSASKTSDIDLLFISEYEVEIRRVLDRFPFKIHATFISYSEFISMANNKEFSVVSEVLKKNVILVGTEEYYRLLKNVK